MYVVVDHLNVHVCVFFLLFCMYDCRYDYLEFTDASGAKTKYDGEVGSERWPKRVEFKGQRLHMHFYSDASNNEWGYKFTVSHG